MNDNATKAIIKRLEEKLKNLPSYEVICYWCGEVCCKAATPPSGHEIHWACYQEQLAQHMRQYEQSKQPQQPAVVSA